MPALLALAALVGCADVRTAEDPSSWYDSGLDISVEEAMAFTDAPYGLPADGAPSMASQLEAPLTFPRGFGTRIDAATTPPADCGWETSDTLPVEITGVVTVLPKIYFKTDGCGRDDEKYYASYFIEDDTRGVFVLADAKGVSFDAGDTVTLSVRSVRRSYDLDMVYKADVLAVDRTARPIHYRELSAPPGLDDIGQTVRVTGTVVSDPDTFGEFSLAIDGGPACDGPGGAGCAIGGLDVELTRRGITVTPGERVTLTGPVLYSYSTFKILALRKPQLLRLDP